MLILFKDPAVCPDYGVILSSFASFSVLVLLRSGESGAVTVIDPPPETEHGSMPEIEHIRPPLGQTPPVDSCPVTGVA